MSFTVDLGKFATKATSKVDRVRKGVMFKLFSAVVLDTPVLEGRLRGNWQASVDKPIQDIIDMKDKAGGATIANIQNKVDQASGDRPVFLTNNLPYAARIEFEGHSHTKAPEGMVRKNVARFNRLISDEAKKP